MTAERVAVLGARQGLHARPAAQFVEAAAGFRSTIVVVAEGGRANGKSILELLALGAAPGSRLTIVATGDDANEAAATLAAILVDPEGATPPRDGRDR